MINKWRAKIHGEEVYNVRSPPRIGEEKKREKGKTVAVLTTLESFCN